MVFSPASLRYGVGLGQCLALHILTGVVIPFTGVTGKKGNTYILQTTCSICASYCRSYENLHTVYRVLFAHVLCPIHLQTVSPRLEFAQTRYTCILDTLSY